MTSINITKSLWFELADEDSKIFVLLTRAQNLYTRDTATGKIQLNSGSSLECYGVVFGVPLLFKPQAPESIYIRATTSKSEAVQLNELYY